MKLYSMGEAKEMKKITILLMVGIVILFLNIGFSGCVRERNSLDNSTLSKIVIKDYDVSIKSIGLDKIYIDNVVVLLKNEGDEIVKVDTITVLSGDNKIEEIFYDFLGLDEDISLTPDEEKNFSLSNYQEWEKEIGIEQLDGKISVTTRKGGVLTEENITIQIPFIKVGDTIEEVRPDISHNLSLIFLSWGESENATNNDYTATAGDGMKLIVLYFECKNSWIRSQDNVYIKADEILTNKGYIYSEIWTDYFWGYNELLPEESIVGCLAFEIPENEIPIEASIEYIPFLINFNEWN